MGVRSHSKGGLRTVPLWRARCGGRGEEGARGLPLGKLGAGSEGLCLSYLDGDHTLTLTTPLPCRLLSTNFPVSPCRWYDPSLSVQVSHQPCTVSDFLAAEGPLSSWDLISESRGG